MFYMEIYMVIRVILFNCGNDFYLRMKKKKEKGK